MWICKEININTNVVKTVASDWLRVCVRVLVVMELLPFASFILSKAVIVKHRVLSLYWLTYSLSGLLQNQSQLNSIEIVVGSAEMTNRLD